MPAPPGQPEASPTLSRASRQPFSCFFSINYLGRIINTKVFTGIDIPFVVFSDADRFQEGSDLPRPRGTASLMEEEMVTRE
jgi:hypothetical protein